MKHSSMLIHYLQIDMGVDKGCPKMFKHHQMFNIIDFSGVFITITFTVLHM